MQQFIRLLLIMGVAVALPSCANYKLHYAGTEQNWKEKHPDPDLKRTHTMYLVGDAGYLPEKGVNPVLVHLKKELAQEKKAASVLFLGDNIYPHGMPRKSEPEARKEAEQRIEAQMDAVADFKGEVIFIAGNHDWANGLSGRRREERYVEEYLNKKHGVDDEDDKKWKNYFLPDDGCSGPEVVEISKDLVVIAIDSEWWLTDWNREPDINDGCEIKSRTHFLFAMENILRKYRNRNVVLAMHHPPHTYGPHGGKFHIKQHLFPLTELSPNLYIPLPGLGTLAALLRAGGGSKQDAANGTYKSLMHGLLTGAKKNGRYIFASGHEHALQYIEDDQQYYVVSGSGSKVSPVGKGKGSKFSYGAPGYSTLEFYDNGECWVQFWVPDTSGATAQLVYCRQVKGAFATPSAGEAADFSEYERHLDSIEVPVIKDPVHDVGGLHKLVLGTHYRDVYKGTYTFPVLDLSTVNGGMIPIQQGGGNQTNSLRLKDAQGRQYVLRDLTKDVSRLLPFPLNKMTAAQSVAMDNFLSTHPFAPLAIPWLAEAIQVYHTNPTICYVPKQPALGDYNADFGGSVYLFEERAGGDWSGTGVFGSSEKVISTPDVVEKTLKNNNHKIDQYWVVRARLFDLLIGDWDRHDDQWRWARFEDGKRKYYRPVPRDRDQAFSKYDGLITTFSRQTMPFLHQLRVYGPEISNMKWATWSARHFDRAFLNQMSWKEWEAEALSIRKNLTDSVIEHAFDHWPRRARELSAAPIIAGLKQRRDSIIPIAWRRYLLLSKEVDVYGTDEKELFEVTREYDGAVRVRVFEISKKGEKKDKVFERLFEYGITEVINLYGVGDDDVFEVQGEAPRSIKVRMIGGLGKDRFTDRSSVEGTPKMTVVYDDKGDNIVDGSSETRDARTRRRIYNLYDHRAAHYEYDYTIPLPIIGVNPDDGFTIGANLTKTTYRFKKDPYAAQHNFVGSISFATKSWFLQYNGDYLNAFGSWDFLLESQFSGPSYAFNYFGIGNDSEADFENRSINYYRVRQGQLKLFPALKKRIAGGNGQFFIGPMLDIRDLEDTEGRFITSDEAGFSQADFEISYFAGARMGFKYNNLDNWLNPHRGVIINTGLNYLNDLETARYSFTALSTDLSLYRPIDQEEALILVTRVGFQHNFGHDFAFYHSPNLGGKKTLRGYRAERFYGKTSYYHNIDLRARVLSTYNRILPFTMGVFCGFDYGRVWLDDDENETWHYDYGGGLWLAPLDGLTLYFGVFQPRENNEDGPRFFFRVGAGF
ncbi:MAG: metallophosphoesterase [Saprospiraceae bacterium]